MPTCCVSASMDVSANRTSQSRAGARQGTSPRERHSSDLVRSREWSSTTGGLAVSLVVCDHFPRAITCTMDLMLYGAPRSRSSDAHTRHYAEHDRRWLDRDAWRLVQSPGSGRSD